MRTLRLQFVCLSILLMLSAGGALAGMATLNPTLDTTLFDSPNGVDNPISNGAGQFLFAGNTGFMADFETRRALLAFDVTSAIPLNAVIETAILQLTVTTAPPPGGTDPFSLHRALAAWGEGTSDPDGNEGRGTAATAGDASWVYREVPGVLWGTPGGEFVASPSASAFFGAQGLPYQVLGPGLVADVQYWVDNPASNYGWFLLGDEGGSQTVRQFASRENGDADGRPVLFVTYTVVPEPAVVGMIAVGVGVLLLRRRRCYGGWNSFRHAENGAGCTAE